MSSSTRSSYRPGLPSRDLPEPRQSGLDGHQLGTSITVPDKLLRRDHPGTNQPHLAADDVPELWELVEAVLAKKSTKRSDARIVLQLVVHDELPLQDGIAFEQRVGVSHHRPELEGIKLMSVPAHDPASEDRRTRSHQPDCYRDDQQRRKEHEQQQESDGRLDKILDPESALCVATRRGGRPDTMTTCGTDHIPMTGIDDRQSSPSGRGLAGCANPDR